MADEPTSRRVIAPGAGKKETVIAVLIALLVLAVVGLAVLNMGRDSAGSGLTGKIVAKRFTERPETQVTIGSGGVQRDDLTGEYFLDVQVRDSRETYHVRLSEEDYARVQVGDTYQIPKSALLPAGN